MNKRISLLAVLLLLTSCGNNQPSGPTQDGEEGEPITRETVHEGVYDIKDSNNTFYNGTKVLYKVITKEDEENVLINKSVSMINKHVSNALQAEIEVSSPGQISTDDLNIVVNRDDLMKTAGIAISEKLTGKVGYQITSHGNSVFIYGTNSEGIRLGIIKFLNATIGYDCLGENLYVYERNGVLVNKNSTLLMPDFHVVEVPDYQLRTFSNISNDDEYFDMGFSDVVRNDLVCAGGFHNQLSDLYPLAEFRDSHPEFYNSSKEQICYTAHGNKDSFDLMVDIGATRLVDALYKPTNLDKTYVFTAHCDVTASGNNWCNCETCQEAINKYSPANNANSVTLIPFMNALTEAFHQKLEEKARELGTAKRDVTLCTIVYHRSQSLSTPDEPVDEMKFDDRLKVAIAPIQFKYDRDLHAPENEYCLEQVQNWQKFTNNIGTWAYNINFGNYLCPYNTFDTAIDYYRMYFNNGSDFMLNEGNWDENHVSHFTAFKDYIDSKCLIDLSVNYKDLEEKFFKYYYGDAGDVMHKFYREMVQTCVYARENGLTDGGIKSDNVSYYSFETLLKFANYIDDANRAISAIKSTDLRLYELLKLNIDIEAIFPHYCLTVHKDTYLSSAMREKYRLMLYNESKSSAIDEVFENGNTLSDYFLDWGL